MNRILSWTTLMFCVLFSACKTVFVWNPKGPFEISGCIKHLMIDPVNAKRLYAGAENGGIWVMDNYDAPNASWRPLTDELENLQSRGLAKSMIDSSYIVMGNGLGNVFHSFDHGRNWSKLCDNNFAYIRRIHVFNGLVRISTGNISRLVKQTKVLVASRLGLYRVELINDRFTKIDTLQATDVLDMLKVGITDQVMFIGIRNVGVLKTSDNGRVWDTILPWNPNRDSNSEIIKLALSGNRIVAKFGRRIFRNDRFGEGNWDEISPPFSLNGGNDIGYRGNYSGLRGEWTHCIAINPVDPNMILAGQEELVFSTNGGNTWTSVSTAAKIGHEDLQEIVFTPKGEKIFIANDGGVYEFDIRGGNAKPMNKNLSTMQFYRVGIHGNNAVGNADHQGIKGTENLNDPNPSWSTATPANNGYGNNGLENDFVYADVKNANRFFVLFQSRDLLRLNHPKRNPNDLLVFSDTFPLLTPFITYTYNNNDSNAKYNQLNYPVNTFAVDPRQHSNTMLVSAHTRLNRTYEVKITKNGDRNSGGGPANNCGDDNSNTICYSTPVTNFSNWQQTFNANRTPVVSIEFSKTLPGKVFMADERGRVFTKREVNDDNEPWVNVGNFVVSNNDFARQITTDAFDSLKVYALSHHGFYRSIDGGVSWNSTGSATLPTIKYNSVAVDPLRRNAVFVATDTAVYVSRNSGDTWEVFGRGLPNAPIMQIFCKDNFLYAVTFGRGLWICDLLGNRRVY